MRIEIRSTALDGSPLDAMVEVFSGEGPLEVLEAIRDAARFSADTTTDDTIERIQQAAWLFAGAQLCVKGSTPEERASSLLFALIDHKLARRLGDEEPGGKPGHVPSAELPTQKGTPMSEKVKAPRAVIDGIETVRQTGRTNMMDRQMVQVIANELELWQVVVWLEDHPKDYGRGLFQGFVADEEAR
ncbi:MAG: DUF5049 domain-containing protein [Armatimonadetes bacterium]|nr:DUF5049 domain-containing protein [Armatimonadota bacterium]